ncbi:MAG: RNA helicase, partial [Rhodanobacteraceae bacterium]
GLALSLVSREEEGLLRDIRRLLKQDITVEAVQAYAPSWSLRLDGPAMPVRKSGRNKSGKPSHARRPHVPHGKGEHAVGNKKRRWRAGDARKA